MLNATDHAYVIVEFVIPNFNSTICKTIPMCDACEPSKLKAYIPAHFVLEGILPQKLPTIISQDIMEQSLKHKPCIMLPQGYNCIENQWCYVLGNHIINKDTLPVTPYNPYNFQLRDLTADENTNWLGWCGAFIKDNPNHAALFLCALTPYIRPVSELLSLPAQAVNAFVVGTSSTGKTSYCKLLTNLGGNMQPGINLSTDRSDIFEELIKYTDCPFLVDDFHSSSSSREKETLVHNLSEMVRISSSGGVTVKKGKTISLDHTALLITGEKIPEDASFINRCVVIEWGDKPKNQGLAALQRYQHLYIKFLISFIEWICVNAQSLTEKIAIMLKFNMRDYHIKYGKAVDYAGYSRIMAAYKLLTIAQELFLMFCSEKYCNDQIYENFGSRLECGVSKAIETTLKYVYTKPGNPYIVNTILRSLMRDPDNIFANSFEKYLENDHYIIFRHKDCYYFRGQELVNYISRVSKEEFSVTALSKELQKAHLLKKHSYVKLPKKLVDKYKTLKNDTMDRHIDINKKFYRMNLNDIVEFVDISCENRDDFIESPIKELRS